MADKINIKKFTKGRAGQFTFDQLNSMVELLERTAEKAARNENALQLAQAAFPESAYGGGKTPIFAEIRGEPTIVEDVASGRAYALYEWREVEFNAATARFEDNQTYPQYGNTSENAAIDTSGRLSGATNEIVSSNENSPKRPDTAWPQTTAC